MQLIINTITAWSEPPRARHQITWELLNLNYQVIYIEKNRSGFPGLNIREVENMTMITPSFFIGHKLRYRLPVLNELYQQWLYRKIRRLFGDQLVVNFDFTAHRLDKHFSNVVYYCNDEQIGNSDYPNFLVNSYHRWCETLVIQQAKICFATSRYLTDKLSRINPASFEIPLGGPDPESLDYSGRSKVHGDKKVVGLVGYITARNISTGLINRLLEVKDVSLVLVGPVDESFVRRIDDPSRIEFKGILKGEALYEAIMDFDVAIAPYEIKSLNPGATSNKLFQYLACGVPVVISAIPNNRGKEFPEGTVYQVEDEDAFVPMVEKALSERNLGVEKSCREVAGKNTWKIRVEQFISLMNQHGIIRED